MVPRAEGVVRKPSPQGGFANGGDEASFDGFAANFWNGEARERETVFVRQLTRQGFDCDHDAGGKSGLDDRAALPLRDRRRVVRRTACATC